MMSICMRYILLICISLFFTSCLEDNNSIRKRELFVFFDNFKKNIDNIDFFKKNSNIENIDSLKDILISNNDSIKNLIQNTNISEYSSTINYTIGDSSKTDTAYFIIRNTMYSPTYYYITLYNKSNKWVIDSINKLPLKK